MLRRATVLLSIVTLSITACGAPAGPDPRAAEIEAFAAVAKPYLSQAKSAEAAEDQIAALEAALEIGEVTFDAYKAALDETFACFADAGIRYQTYPPDDSGGLTWLPYVYESPDEHDPLALECVTLHSKYIEQLYQLQPAAVEATWANFDRGTPVLLACLVEGGYVTVEEASDPDLTRDEILLFIDRGFEGDDEAGALCLMEADISAY